MTTRWKERPGDSTGGSGTTVPTVVAAPIGRDALHTDAPASDAPHGREDPATRDDVHLDLADRIRETARRLRGALDVQDLAAVAVLVAATLHLVGRDGGRHPREMIPTLVVVAIGTLLLAPTWRRNSRGFALLLAALALAPLTAVAFAEIRAGITRPLVVWALAPTVALATVHLWRRPFGPRLIGAVLAVTAAAAWYGTFLVWWGSATGRPMWMALSWHNQSGTLMGALGVGFAAVGLTVTSARARIAAVVLAGACLAGTWLSGSRGAVLATGLGVALVVAGALRNATARDARRRGLAALVAVAVTAVIVVTALEAMVTSDGGQPLTTRSQSASNNLSARVGHWEAVVGMVASRPVTGWGPGSYRWASLPHYPGDTNLTSSAHNEYLEVLGESGLVGALPVWLAVGAVAWMALGATLGRSNRRRPSSRARTPGADSRVADERRIGTLAAAGVAVVLGVHAAADFDWDYPLLLALLVLAGGVLWAQRDRPTADAQPPRLGPAPAVLATAALAIGVAAGLTAALVGHPEPWDLDGRLRAAVRAAEQHDDDAARAALAEVERWNPGAPSLPVVTAVVDHRAGRLGHLHLAAAVGPDHASSSDHLLVARRLLEVGEVEAVRRIVDDLALALDGRRAWRPREAVAEAAALRLVTEERAAGCAAAQRTTPTVMAWVAGFDADPALVATLMARLGPDETCSSAALEAWTRD